MQTHPTGKASAVQGFTLIELSIVLIVIGLIVGAIFVGRDLIHAAVIRAQLFQIEKYKSAVHTFKTKYNVLPGDLSPNDAIAYGFFARGAGPSGLAGDGDGNGLIEGCTSGPLFASFEAVGCETAFFWTDLSAAQLIDGSFTQSADGYVTALTQAAIAQYVPVAKLKNGNYIIAYGMGSPTNGDLPKGLNYFEIENITSITGNIVGTNNITPLEAFTMDQKVDDGLPTTGTVLAVGNNAFPGVPGFVPPPAAPAAGVCVSNATTPNSYNVTSAYSDTFACSLAFVGGF